jgi:hypothetical protein
MSINNKNKLALGGIAASIAVLALAGAEQLISTSSSPAFTKAALEVDQEPIRYKASLGYSCGVEAWAVKTLTDPNASQVNLTPLRTTVPRLDAMSVTSEGQRTNPPQVFKLKATRLIKYKLEPDSDIHLVLQSTLDASKTMIAEIPDPACASGSRVYNQIVAARAAFVSQIGSPQSYFISLNQLINVQGVGFFDYFHGQTGVAPNAIELHPVIAFSKYP